ncbi:hypothetical protein ACTHGU_21495 [Chitinophagaceae bacterium MMS25-I14]
MTTNSESISHHTQQLKFNPEGLDKEYEVAYYINNELLIQYNIAIEFIRREKKHYVVQLNRTDVESNGEQNHAYELAKHCGQTLYPLECLINEQAEIISVHNHKEIINRWLKESVLIKQYYAGETADDYIAQTEETLMMPEKLLEVLQNDLFLKIYFMPVSSNVRDSPVIQQRVTYPLQAPVTFMTKHVASADPENGELYHVTISGIAEDQNVDAAMKGIYMISKRSHHIEQADILWQTGNAGSRDTINMTVNTI